MANGRRLDTSPDYRHSDIQENLQSLKDYVQTGVNEETQSDGRSLSIVRDNKFIANAQKKKQIYSFNLYSN